MPTAGKADDSAHNNHQAKWQRTIIPVAMADGSKQLQKTWEMSVLSDQKDWKRDLAKFRVHPIYCCQCLYLLYSH